MAFTIAILKHLYIKLLFYLIHQLDQSANASRVTSYNVLLPVQKLNKLEDGYAVYTALSYFKYYNVIQSITISVTRFQDTGILCF